MESRAEGERSIERHCREGRHDEATAEILELYGAEVTGLLVAMARDDAQAADAYSVFCERIWRSLPAFRFESSVRTWAYVIARRSLSEVRRAERRGPAMVAASPSQLPELVARARTSTQAHLQTTYKRELREVRALLSPDDQLLLVLRLDRSMAWDEIARVLSDEDEPDPEQLRRSSATVRKRFSRAKARLSTELRARRAAREE